MASQLAFLLCSSQGSKYPEADQGAAEPQPGNAPQRQWDLVVDFLLTVPFSLPAAMAQQGRWVVVDTRWEGYTSSFHTQL